MPHHAGCTAAAWFDVAGVLDIRAQVKVGIHTVGPVEGLYGYDRTLRRVVGVHIGALDLPAQRLAAGQNTQVSHQCRGKPRELTHPISF